MIPANPVESAPTTSKPSSSDYALLNRGTSMSDNPFFWKAAIIVGSGGLIFGYDIGVISGTLGALKDKFNLSGYEQGLVVAILNAGSIVGCLFGGPMCDILGRWKTIHIQNFVFILGALITGLANDLPTLCAGRFLVGVASAISGLADVPYLTEIAPSQYRGLLSGQYEILVAVGVLLSFCLDLAFSTFSSGWRVAFILPAVFALAQSIGLFLIPESPKWLLAQGMIPQARLALDEIFSKGNVDRWIEQYELLEAEQLAKERAQNAGSSHHSAVLASSGLSPASMNAALAGLSDCPTDVTTYIKLSKPRSLPFHSPSMLDAEGGRGRRESQELSNYIAAHPSTSVVSHATFFTLSEEEKAIFKLYRYPIVMLVIIQLLSQSATVIRNYAPTIFEDSGTSTQVSLILNIILGIVKLIFTTIGVFTIERPNLGRRGLLLIGIIIVCSGLAFLTLASAASRGGNLHSAGVFIGGCALIYAGFGLGYGPVPWILSSEMVPTAIRGRIMSVSLIASNVSQMVTGLIFVPMFEGITSTGGFGVLCILNVINLVYIYLFLSETRDVLPEIILDDLERRYEQFFGRTFNGSARTARQKASGMGFKSTELSIGHEHWADNPLFADQSWLEEKQ